MKRMGWVIYLRPEKKEEYLALHTDVWPGVLKTIKECGIKNYTIFLREPENLMFGFFEYHGSDYEADMAKMAADETTQKWWALTDPCQLPLSSSKKSEQWGPMREVFHCD